MFGWETKTEQLRGEAFEKARDRVGALVADDRRRRRAIRASMPLFGFSGRRTRVGWWMRLWGWFSSRLRYHLKEIGFQYLILKRNLSAKDFPKVLGERQMKIANQLEKLKRWHARRALAVHLAEDLGKQYRNLIPALQTLYLRMDKLRRLTAAWERQEKDRLIFLFWKQGSQYEYHAQDTKRNVAFLKGLRDSLIDQELHKIDETLRSLSSGGKDLVGVLEDIGGARQDLRRNYALLGKQLATRSFSATDRYKGEEELKQVKGLLSEYSALGRELERVSEEFKAGTLGGKSFRQREREIRQQFEKLERRRRIVQRAASSVTRRGDKLTSEEEQHNRDVAEFTRKYLLDLVLQESTPWLDDVGKGEIPGVAQELRGDQQFRRFTQHVTNIGPRLGRAVATLLLKDYPYLVRDFEKKLDEVYQAIHDANLIYLRQMAGALGKELPPYIPNLERQMPEQTALPRFIETTANEIVNHCLKEQNQEEKEKWLTLISHLVPEEMIQSNRSRRPS